MKTREERQTEQWCRESQAISDGRFITAGDAYAHYGGDTKEVIERAAKDGYVPCQSDQFRGFYRPPRNRDRK